MNPEFEQEPPELQSAAPGPGKDPASRSVSQEAFGEIEGEVGDEAADLTGSALNFQSRQPPPNDPSRRIWDSIERMIIDGISFKGYLFDNAIDRDSISLNFGIDPGSVGGQVLNAIQSLLEKEDRDLCEKVEPGIYYFSDYLVMRQESELESASSAVPAGSGPLERKLNEVIAKLEQSAEIRQAFYLGTNYNSELSFMSEMADVAFEELIATRFRMKSEPERNEAAAGDLELCRSKYRSINQKLNDLIARASTPEVVQTLERVNKKVRKLQVEKQWLGTKIEAERHRLEKQQELDREQTIQNRRNAIRQEIAEIRQTVNHIGGRFAEELSPDNISVRRILTRSRAARTIMRIEEFDANIYDNKIAAHNGVPDMLLFPYRGHPFIMLDKNLMVLPVYCPDPIEHTVARAFAVYRLHCDINNTMRDSFIDAHKDQVFLKSRDIFDTFTHAYIDWIVSGTRLRSQLPAHTKRWFNRHIAPPTDNLIVPRWYKITDLSMINMQLGIDNCLSHIEKNPDDAESYFKMGILYYLQGNLMAAANANIQATRIDPDFAYAHYNLGILLERQNLRQKAKKVWQNFLVVEKNSWWSLSARRHLARLGGY